MPTLFIVDDEPVVRQSIRQFIPWGEHDIQVVGEASDGRAALQRALKLQPDIILCDIRMPVEDGISFVEKLRDILPDTRVIFLTGYTDQTYMMEAIRIRVHNYLVKPAPMEQILEAVLKIRDELYRRDYERLEFRSRESLFEEKLEVLRENFICELLGGTIGEDEAHAQARALSIPLPGPAYALVLAKAGHSEPLGLLHACTSAFQGYGATVVFLRGGKIVACILNLMQAPSQDTLGQVSRLYFQGCGDLSGALVISEISADITGLSGQYQRAGSLVERGIWYPKGSFLSVGDCDLPPLPEEELAGLERRLFDALREGYPNTISRCAEQFFDTLAGFRPEINDFTNRIKRVQQAVVLMGGLCASDRELDNAGYDPERLRAAFLRICGSYQSERRYGSGQIGRALRYMELNFTQDLTLEKVAAQLYISSTYLSRLLNEKTQLGFQGWLHYFRIQKAKELLARTPAKHYEIAEMVGYHSYKVFSDHFLSQTGSTARQYRARHRNDVPSDSAFYAP